MELNAAAPLLLLNEGGRFPFLGLERVRRRYDPTDRFQRHPDSPVVDLALHHDDFYW